MKRVVRVVLAFGILLTPPASLSQEKFNDVRQRLADFLTAVKTAARASDQEAARKSFEEAQKTWTAEVKPMIVEGLRSNDQFQEYFDRMADVDTNLAMLAQEMDLPDLQKIEARVNSIIWGISHHPRGFSVPAPRYTAWDWVFGLGIGIGFCLFAILFGLYLRRSYYRRYSNAPTGNPKG